jgi:hypothetical protein
MFYKGQQVVCVDDSNGPIGNGYNAGLRKGSIYTITEIESISGELYFYLAEISRGGWKHIRFRPIQKKETDISVFKALLNPANHKQLEDA